MKLTQDKFEELVELWSSDHVLAVESLFGVELTDQQKNLVRLADDQQARVAVASCTGSGKALRNSEKIHTPTGLKAMGDLKVGDDICNSYGSVSKVTAVYPQGKKDVYRVSFNNGTYVDCCIDHLWTVSSYHSNTDFTTLSLGEIIKKGYTVKTKVTDRNPKGMRLKYYLPSIDPVYKEDTSLEIPPYVLGAWIGDGGRITNVDPEVWETIEKRGYSLSKLQGITKTVYGLSTQLKTLGIFDKYSYEKHIPKDYLEGPIHTRAEVLRGLMDTDGTVGKTGDLSYSTSSPRLAEDFVQLVRSLGGSTKGVKTKKTTHRDSYTVHFQLETIDRIFYIERKQERVKYGKVNSSRVYIENIEKLEGVQDEMTCITVDAEDSLFICENYMPTHNTAVLSMLTFLYLMILPDCRILITSPSFNQLNRVFYSELRKWHRKMPEVFQEMYKITRERVDYINTKRYEQSASLVTASVENKESLQGGHAENYIIFADEASGISEEAFDILLGTLSTGEGGRFIQVSNPVRSSGRFYQIFATNLGDWHKLHFSAMESPNVNDKWIEEMRETYGEDSDLYRMRVLGQFPRVGVAQFISADMVEEAIQNELPYNAYNNFPKVMGVDVARFGDDLTVFVVRQGPKLLDIRTFKGLDTMEVASEVASFQAIHMASCIFVDSIGVGAGVFDRCKDIGLPVKEVVVSLKSSEPKVYSNLRAQLWGNLRTWLESADLPHFAKSKECNLAAQLTSMEYTYNNKMQLQLLGKKELKRAGHASPDIADAVSLTFADIVFATSNRRTVKRVIKRSRYSWV